MKKNNQASSEMIKVNEYLSLRTSNFSEKEFKIFEQRMNHAVQGGYSNRLIKTDCIRQNYVEFMSSNSPKYAVTILFTTKTSNVIRHQLLNQFCYKINEMILKGAFKKGNKQLEIFASRENAENQRKNMNKDWLDSYHYHLVFKSPNNEINYDLEQFIEIVLKAARFANKSVKIKGCNILLGKNIDIQSYEDKGAKEWETYITKIFEDFKLSTDNMSDNIGVYEGKIREMLFD